MITYPEVLERMGVTEMALDMAIYSGRLPKPRETVFGVHRWAARKLEPHLVNWEAQIKRRNKNDT